MKSVFTYAKNSLKISIWKLMYYNRLKIGLIQSFDDCTLEIHGSSMVDIGSFNQNRGRLYLGVENGKLQIGDHCFFNINTSITCMDNISIGDYCKIGNNVVIVDHDHNFRCKEPEFLTAPIHIGKNVWVGANVVILRGSRVGDNCVIAAGSIVKGDVPNNSVYISSKSTPFSYCYNVDGIN